MKYKGFYFPFPLILCVLLCGFNVFSQITSNSQPQANAGRIHFGDLVDVDVIGSFEFDWRGTLTPEGFLDGFDKIEEPVYALCRSEEQLAEAITIEFAKTLRDPKVAVRVLDRSNRAVAYVDGAVKIPQRFQIRRPIMLNELLIISGGVTDQAGGNINIFRPLNVSCSSNPDNPATDYEKVPQDNALQNRIITIKDLLSGKPQANPHIFSGDIITVLAAAPIYLIGGVNVPKQISSRSQITLSRAISSAGGVSKHGIEEQVTIFRREGDESHVITADLKKIKENGADDPLLKAFDIIEVAEKGRQKRRFPPFVENRGYVSSVLAKLPLRIVD
ncbi:MAG: SLBB domain-containing protein [Pyrinomonadaceae bacterium]